MGLFDIFKRKEKDNLRVLDVTDNDFDLQVLQRSFKQLVMVDFWASWCAPCKRLGPELERVATDPVNDIMLLKLNTEYNQHTAQRFNIRSIPNVKFFRNGAMVGEFVGYQPATNIRAIIEKVRAQPMPKPRLKIEKKPSKRLGQAKAYLRKGDGFRATMVLRDFPAGNLADEAAHYLTLARFMWNLDDSDALTGNQKIDEILIDAVEAIESQEYATALTLVEEGIQSGKTNSHANLEKVKASLTTLQ